MGLRFPPLRLAIPALIFLATTLFFIVPSVRVYLGKYTAVMSVTFAFLTSLAGRRSDAAKTERNAWFALTIMAGLLTIYSVVNSEQHRAVEARMSRERYEHDKKESDIKHDQDVNQQRLLFSDVIATLREMSSAPMSSFKRKVLSLAANILDFHADRTAPHAIVFGEAVIPLSPEQQAEYDSETVQQYKNRFAGPVANVVADLKAYGLSDRDLDDMTLRDPEVFTIRRIGEGLRRLGNQLK